VDPAACVESARRFDVQEFRKALPREVDRVLARRRSEPATSAHRGEPVPRPRPRLGLARRGPTRRPFA
jgi:hypothetical protein